MKKVTIYTDGACSGNPGPGGWGCVLMYNQHRKESSGGAEDTTNNRMEITAALEALKLLKGKRVLPFIIEHVAGINGPADNPFSHFFAGLHVFA